MPQSHPLLRVAGSRLGPETLLASPLVSGQQESPLWVLGQGASPVLRVGPGKGHVAAGRRPDTEEALVQLTTSPLPSPLGVGSRPLHLPLHPAKEASRPGVLACAACPSLPGSLGSCRTVHTLQPSLPSLLWQQALSSTACNCWFCWCRYQKPTSASQTLSTSFIQ